MSMTNNNFDTNNSSSNYDALPKQFINYINYELSLFEKITNKKFLFNVLRNDRFELNVYESKKKRFIFYLLSNVYDLSIFRA